MQTIAQLFLFLTICVYMCVYVCKYMYLES